MVLVIFQKMLATSKPEISIHKPCVCACLFAGLLVAIPHFCAPFTWAGQGIQESVSGPEPTI